MDERLVSRLEDFNAGTGLLTVLTGAGISAESGIPTFRGPEGYWTIGSREYHPQEMATNTMFSRHPADVWQWYLYRAGVCGQAEPNRGHAAVVALERAYEDRFLLITQNVDGLHLRAGNSPERTFQIHGNIFFRRCSHECSPELFPMPPSLVPRPKTRPLSDDEAALLRCPKCARWSRPHVLWFDECYDEAYFRFESSLRAAARTRLLIVAGTSGATNLPMQVGSVVAHSGGLIVDVNPKENPFSAMAIASSGFHCAGSAADILPDLARLLGANP